MVGADESRFGTIRDATFLNCEGCGCRVVMSEPLIGHMKQQCTDGGFEPYICCSTCAQPFFDAVAAGDGSIAGTPGALSEYVPKIAQERNRFIQSRN